ncbi:S8 family peptidase [Sphingomonas sp. LHG3406-1]|uniref:S8 family peptidase n=1 Tax=Sphingomonas sp. LHG3406-1 TaxID=2804617 RepID=UPI00263440EE|nr:S8 family peptidase [Sphingomonas sp. LHG3406-1]
MRKALLGTSASLVMLSLSACGGGGGGGSVGSTPPPPTSATPAPAPTPAPTPTPSPTPTPTPAPPPVTTVNYNTPEYSYSNAAVASGAIAAYNKGATGQGIKVGVIDSGINTTLSEFAGRIDSASRDVTTGGRSMGDDKGHGTAVAGVIAANNDGNYMHGVAFDSTIIALRADTPGSCTDTEGDGCSFADSSIARGVDAAVAAGARVINMSLGGSAPGSTLIAALQRAVNKGVVIVISAGNDGDKPEGVNADPFAAVPAGYFPGQVIIAGSVGSMSGGSTVGLDQLSSFSNRAGTAASNYLAAIGSGVRTVDKDGAWTRWSGTSFAAPTVSGAVALLASAFPNLTGAQIVDILFRSADDLGVAGTDSIFGRGRLNVTRAMQPIGSMTLAGSGEPITGSSSAPPASGDAPPVGGNGLGAIVLDGYSRAFAVDLARGIRSAPRTEPLHRALGGSIQVAGGQAGPVSIAMTVAENRNGAGFSLRQTGIGPEDMRKARLVAGSAVARLDDRTAIALGFAEGAKAMERRLSGANSGAFLVARDIAGNPGFDARRGGALAVRRNLGPVGMTLSGETGEVYSEIRTGALGAPYRWTSMSLDRSFGRTWLSAGLGRLEEKRSILGGHMADLLGGGGAGTNFLDIEARRDLGRGWTASLSARRGWTSFAGGSFTSGAYGFDLAKTGLLTGDDLFGLRLSQPLRIDGGGFAVSLPTSYDYGTLTPGYSIVRSSLVPRGREVDAELSYQRRMLATGWLGGNLFVRRQPGHIAAADADVGGAVRFSLGF